MRLSKIYTKAGDSGQTALATGKKELKCHSRLTAYGTVDELSCFLAQLHHFLTQEAVFQTYLGSVRRIQHELFDLGGELSFPEKDPYLEKLPCKITEETIQKLEEEMDQMSHHLPALKNFILPGGSLVASTAHICRSICRRAERELVALMQKEEVRKELLRYLNRLSDWLFVLSRTLVKLEGKKEILWEQKRS